MRRSLFDAQVTHGDTCDTSVGINDNTLSRPVIGQLIKVGRFHVQVRIGQRRKTLLGRSGKYCQQHNTPIYRTWGSYGCMGEGRFDTGSRLSVVTGLDNGSPSFG